MFKNLKWSMVLSSVCYIVLGLVLIIFPDVSMSILTNVLGVGFILFGAFDIIGYLLMDTQNVLMSNAFVRGTVFVILGLIVMFQMEKILGLIPILLGLGIVISGFNKLQQAITARRLGYQRASTYIVLAIISIVLGLAVMFFINGQNVGDALFICIGVGLVYSGLSDLYTTFVVSKKFNDFISEVKKEQNRNVIDIDMKDGNEKG